MGVATPLKTIETLADIEDPEEWKRKVFDLIGNEMPRVHGNRVLCAVYIQPGHHAQGTRNDGSSYKILKTTDSMKEDIWQSKLMMVLAVGPAAFKDTNEYSHYGITLKPGDWVMAQIHNCSQREIKKMPCRSIQDYLIEEDYEDPRTVTS